MWGPWLLALVGLILPTNSLHSARPRVITMSGSCIAVGIVGVSGLIGSALTRQLVAAQVDAKARIKRGTLDGSAAVLHQGSCRDPHGQCCVASLCCAGLIRNAAGLCSPALSSSQQQVHGSRKPHNRRHNAIVKWWPGAGPAGLRPVPCPARRPCRLGYCGGLHCL